MNLYNTVGVLTKYKSVLDIIQEFFEYRFKIYTKRKEEYTKLLLNELELLKEKMRFIKYYLNGTKIDKDEKKKFIDKGYLKEIIIVAGQKKDNIIQQLENNNFKKLSKNYKTSDDDKSYDYITDMRLFSLTIEKIEELEKELNKKQEEHDTYVKKTEIDLWKEEIENFIDFYKKWHQEKIERKEKDDTGDDKKKNKSKTKSKK